MHFCYTVTLATLNRSGNNNWTFGEENKQNGWLNISFNLLGESKKFYPPFPSLRQFFPPLFRVNNIGRCVCLQLHHPPSDHPPSLFHISCCCFLIAAMTYCTLSLFPLVFIFMMGCPPCDGWWNTRASECIVSFVIVFALVCLCFQTITCIFNGDQRFLWVWYLSKSNIFFCLHRWVSVGLNLIMVCLFISSPFYSSMWHYIFLLCFPE